MILLLTFVSYLHRMDIEILEEAAPAAVKAPNPVMDMILEWIGFNQEATHACIREEVFETFADLATMKEKDIRDLAESCSRCTVADAGRAIFGLRRIRYMIGLIHWVQDLVESVKHQPWKAWTKLSHSGMLWTRPISALMSERLRRTSPIPSARLLTPENSKMKGNAWPEWEPAFAKQLSLHYPGGERHPFVVRHLGEQDPSSYHGIPKRQ